MSTHPNPPPPPVPPSPPSSGGVRRHHTISASSRASRAAARESISEEVHDQTPWNDDEPVDQDWVGGVGAVGEKTLHRQSSLPTKYHRGFQGSSKSGNVTPKTVNSLAAIAGHEGDEEPWNITGGYPVEDEHPAQETQHQQVIDNQSRNSPLSPHFAAPPHIPSPPPAANIRRHVSLTYGASTGSSRKINSAGLKRSGTLQAPIPPNSQSTTPPDTAHGPEEEDEYAYDAEDPALYEEEHSGQQGQLYIPSPIGRQSPWAPPPSDWRTAPSSGFSGNPNPQNVVMDDVQRALSTLELTSNNQNVQNQIYSPNPNYQTGQSAHPPRFNPTHPPPALTPGMRGAGNNGNGNNTRALSVDFEGRKTPQSQGGSYFQQQYQQDNRVSSTGGSWDNNKDRGLVNRTSNPNLQYGYQQAGKRPGSPVPNVPLIPQQYLQQHSRMTSGSFGQSGAQQGNSLGQSPEQSFITPSIDVPSLIATKGYNPPNFDIRPQFARFFVIKSYTEDDVHKSLKYEIWSSTDPGNKRLDKAFKETAGRGPIYLFFSVNASGHFCGMAEMLTPVDYTRSSTVWASDKWKGVFKVRWIFVRDIPNVNLRHIKLNNTQERKPVTNSRDTQELLPEAGQEMLRIFHTHPARTSLLQDFAFYELQSLQKMQNPQGYPQSPDSNSQHSPQPQHQQTQPQQSPFSMAPNPDTVNYVMPQMSPMMMQMQMNMGMGMGMGMGGTQYGMPQTQAMHQSVMRHSSGTPNIAGQGYMGF